MLTLSFAAACSSGGPDESSVGDGASVGSSEQTSEPTPTEDATTDPAGTDDSSAQDPTTDPATSDAGTRAGLLAAIALAEEDAGGTAFEVDVDDGGFNVRVAVDGQEVEVDTDADGTEVLRTDPDGALDRDDAEGLDAAQVGLAEAIEIAAAEHGGEAAVDDIDLSRETAGFVWDVAFVDDVEIRVDVVGGSAVRSTDD